MKRLMIVGASVLAPAGLIAAGVNAAPATPAPVAIHSTTETDPIEPEPAPIRHYTVVTVAAKPVPHKVIHEAVHKKKTVKRHVKPKVKTVKPRTFSTNTSWNAPALQAIWHRYPSWVQQTGLCIAHHESWHSGLWVAQNSRSSASGMGQWLTASWQVQAARAGFSGPAKAKYASPAEQVAVMAYQLAHYGAYPWKGAGCGHGS